MGMSDAQLRKRGHSQAFIDQLRADQAGDQAPAAPPKKRRIKKQPAAGADDQA